MKKKQQSKWVNSKKFNIESESWLDFFNQSVMNTPEKPALYFKNESLSYRVLNNMANSFANEINHICNDDDIFVGICMDRTPDMLAAMIGVHKAGKSYLPLESTFPIFRLNHMLKDSETNIIITDNKESLSRTLKVPQKIKYIDACKERNFDDHISSVTKKDDISYIMYTSGSTGLPKGVVITHGSFLNFLLSMRDEPGCCQKDIILSITTISFDISGLELFLPLICGASLYLTDKNAIFNPKKLVKTIADNNISLVQTTPTIWKILLDAGFTGNNKMKILCGGEALPKRLANKLFNTGCEIWNMYGPTETTVWSSIYQIDRIQDSAPPIGKPIANTGLHILDDEMKPVLNGKSGQLWISGAGLAKSYWNNDHLTDLAFHKDPFNPMQLLYRTGDCVIENKDGQIDFIGRFDNQVKIRGLRIEISEIERTIRELDGVEDAVVLAGEDHQKNPILVGYYKCKANYTEISHKVFRTYLSKKLPDYMIPTFFHYMDEFPQTLNKKVDRKSFPKIALNLPKAELIHEKDKLKNTLFKYWSQNLCHSDFSYDDNFFDIGGHSLLVIQITKEISEYLDREIKPLLFFQFPTINLQYRELLSLEEEEKTPKNDLKSDTDDLKDEFEEDDFSLAIIGLSCAVPGADNPQEFWKLLENGRSGITEYSKNELISEGFSPELVNRDNYVRSSGHLPSSKFFDAQFFGYSPKEARFMDPQHRLMLEHCYKALESGSVIPSEYTGKIGVFASSGQNKYLIKNILFSSEKKEWSDFQTMIGNDNDFLASKVAYKNNLRGPAITVQTACSSSLVAIQLAYQSLISYQSDMALCGGVSLNLPLIGGYLKEEGSILSADGLCRAFDKDASGTVFGSGIGVVLLKRLKDAKKDNDHIIAVLRSAAINNDGSQKIGFTAPSVQGQIDVIKEAHNLANIDSKEISYIEAHGTGTILGDPIEVMALSEAFKQKNSRKTPCYIGSVKSNIGHLDAAAGIIGLIKTSLALYHKKIPASLNFKRPNPKMNIEKTPFEVITELKDWKPIGNRRIAGVSSFGIGGTNAHVILESFNNSFNEPKTDNKILLYPISGKNPSVITDYKNIIMRYLNSCNKNQLINSAFTLANSRIKYNYRDFITISPEPNNPYQQIIPVMQKPKTVMLFPGQNGQYPGMCKRLYESNKKFRALLKSCFDLIDKETGWISADIMFDSKLNSTEFTQPLLFAAEWALCKTLMEYDVPCDILVGHSLGEFTAACLAGAFSLEEGIKLIIHRGRIMAKAGSGKMLVASISINDINSNLIEGLDIAAINTENQIVFSGEESKIITLERKLQNLDITCKLLTVDSPFHSRVMEGILPEFKEALKSVNFTPIARPVISNLTGELLEVGYLYNTEYWTEHLRNPVFFDKGIRTLKDEKELVFIEVGPGNILGKFIHSIHNRKDKRIIPMLPSRFSEDDFLHFINSLGEIWKTGIDISLDKINCISNGKNIPMPTYPFEKIEHWIYPDKTDIDIEALHIKEEHVSGNRNPQRSALSTTLDELNNIWKILLGYDEIDSEQNFFDLGGDSLLSAELLRLINFGFKIEFKFSDIFLYPTLKEMAEQIFKAQTSHEIKTDSFPILFPVQSKGKLTPLFLVAGAHGNRYYNEKTRVSSYERIF